MRFPKQSELSQLMLPEQPPQAPKVPLTVDPDDLAKDLMKPLPREQPPRYIGPEVNLLGDPLSTRMPTSPVSPAGRTKMPKASLQELEPWDEGSFGKTSAPCLDKERSIWFDNKIKSPKIRVSPDWTSATFRNMSYGGFVMSATPLRRREVGRYFEIVIEEVDDRWNDGLGIGVCMSHSSDILLSKDATTTLDGFAYEVMPKSWLLGYDGRAKLCGASRYLRGKEIPNGMWRPNQLRVGDVVAILVTQDGHMLQFVNGDLVYYVMSCGMPWRADLHAVLDLDGCVTSVHLVDINGAPRKNVLRTLQSIRESEAQVRRTDSEAPENFIV